MKFFSIIYFAKQLENLQLIEHRCILPLYLCKSLWISECVQFSQPLVHKMASWNVFHCCHCSVKLFYGGKLLRLLLSSFNRFTHRTTTILKEKAIIVYEIEAIHLCISYMDYRSYRLTKVTLPKRWLVSKNHPESF